MTQKFTAEEVRAYAAALSRALQDYREGRSTLASIDQYAASAPGILEAYADTLSKPADSGQAARQYFYHVGVCEADTAHSPDCVCWHDEGTWPMADADGDTYGVTLEWRNKPVATEPSQPADSGRVGDDAVERAVRAHDREDAAQKGEPDPWAEGFPEPYRSERMTAMRLAITAALAAQGQGEVFGWVITDGEGGYFFRKTPPSDFDREWAAKYNRHYTPVFDAPAASPAGVPDAVADARRMDFVERECITVRCEAAADDDVYYEAVDYYMAEPKERVIGIGKTPREAIDAAMLGAAPSAPEGRHIDRARFEKAPCYLCGYNGPGYYQPKTHSCADKYHAAAPEGDGGNHNNGEEHGS